MDNEILNKLRKIKESYLEEDGLRSVLLEDISFIDEVINELERFYNMKPVGYTNEDELNYREKEETNGLFFSTIDNECCPIPLYRLDK
ncbi:TPA: hypothetical protein MDC20_003293 [Morganella morganii]|uniref:hypothetical protein n=1 Tax=Morganella morganii TaxID=582 RepID=UPI000F5A6502|nr:hypothetical protein [Morganella morganii]HBU8232628.1 hypothetical protein [Morganella morganii]